MNDINIIIRNRRLELGLTMLDVAKKVGVSEGTVSRWESGDIANMKRDKIVSLAKALNLSPAIIMGWEDDTATQIPQYPNIYPIETKKFPLLGEIACGEPIWANEEYESYVEADADIRADFCLKAKGDSMIGARIMDGDIVFIRRQDMVDNGEIAAVIIDNEVMLKRVYYDRQGQQLSLVSENPKYGPFNYRGEELDHIRILGKAVTFLSEVR